MALSSGWQLAADIGGGLLSSLVGGSLMANSAASQQDRQFSHNWGLMDHQAALNSAAMQEQNNYNVLNYAQRYQLAKGDLKAAGFNPILAATQGVGGNIQGVSALGAGLNSVGQSSIPDYVSGLSSALQGAFGRSVQKQQLGVASRDLDLKERDINSAIDQRRQDMVIQKGRFDLEKMVQEASVKRADALNSAKIQEIQERLEMDREHFERMDLNGAAMAAAAMQSANAAGLQAAVAAELSISKQEVMAAERAYLGLQSDNAEESLKWQRWLNDHPSIRGAVGFLGSVFDTFALAKGVKNIGSSLSDLVD